MTTNSTRYQLAAISLAASFVFVAPLTAQEPTDPATPAACASIVLDAERLACYDLAVGRAPTADTPAQVGALASGEAVGATVSLLDSRWELLPDSRLGTFSLRAYRPVYVLPWVGTSDVNHTPSSPTRPIAESQGLSTSELEFQVSWKTKAWQGVFGDHGDLWLAYTQSSRWQVFNAESSRPFRETNYEPEVLLVFPTNYNLGGWTGRMLAVGINHESNGRDEPRSRSWNRVTATVAFDRPGWTLSVRPWWRVAEDLEDDDNPDIEDYMGRADIRVIRRVRHHELSVMARHTLRDGDRSRGAVQLDWAFPIRGNLRGHVELFHGYGESLIDYNFSTTRLGLGFSLIEWY